MRRALNFFLRNNPFSKTYLRFQKGARHPLRLRKNTTDRNVLDQVFQNNSYGFFEIQDPRLIVDCGANAGYSSVFFLNRYPACKVVAVEPDKANFELCKKNLSLYGGRALLLKKGVWPEAAGLRVLDRGEAWAHQVRSVKPGEAPDIEAVDLNTLIADRTVDLLKMDIEGSEKEVFSRNTEWLAKVKNIAIEFHGAECEKIFEKALEPYAHDPRLFDGAEIYFYGNIRRRS